MPERAAGPCDLCLASSDSWWLSPVELVGSKGKGALDWWLPEDSPAQLMALVDLSTLRLWLFLKEEIPILAQQRSGGRFHLYMYTDPTARPKKARLAHAYEFQKYLLENRAHELFGI